MVGICVAVAMLAGCRGFTGVASIPQASNAADTAPHSRTFKFIGVKQVFRVPPHVRQIRVVGRGGKGAGTSVAYGGRVSAVIRVTPGEKLVVYVGGDASGTSGGFNGGANGGFGEYCRNCPGYGGGGASDVRARGGRLSDRIVVIAGGGGQGGINPYGYGENGAGGKGGGTTGGSGGSSPSGCGGSGGSGGTPYAGGKGGRGGICYIGSGNPGADGMLGIGGRGGQHGYWSAAGGGGGGGGYYGGGGGGAGGAYNSGGQGSGGGGGGGSSYVEPSAAGVRMWSGWKTSAPNGLIVFDW